MSILVINYFKFNSYNLLHRTILSCAGFRSKTMSNNDATLNQRGDLGSASINAILREARKQRSKYLARLLVNLFSGMGGRIAASAGRLLPAGRPIPAPSPAGRGLG